MNFRELAEKTESYIIEQRRFFHACPELSMQEKETTKAIIAQLEAMGLEVKTFDGYYGCMADIVGDQPGKMVALRADIDALPILEETGLPFASKNEGCMHACGHDCHISMLLGAAKMLTEVKDQLKGTVRLIFQPSEEAGSYDGAPALIDQGVLEGVDAIYGAHIWNVLEAPYINIESGNRMASTAEFHVEIEGLSTHGSSPEAGIDAIVVMSAIIMNLQTFVSRNNSPLNPLVVSVGKVEAGSRWNVIAGKAKFEGTVRTFSPELLEEAPKAIARIVENTAAAYGATAKLSSFEWMVIPVINSDEKLVKIGQEAVKKMYGEEALKPMITQMGGEDFSYYMRKVPGVFAFIGSHNPETGKIYSNHHEKYDVDEDVLKRGAAVYAQFAHDFLAQE
ncbi:MAG: amidohydrolase [Oscillospiraceae bacterium]|nr:amidohydrolase [Oscillospiraceae bacterium]MBR6608941.1 amidohydrolase [Oscillospiraceae bacterium]